MRNRKGQEIGGHTYFLFTLNLLRNNGGVLTGDRLEQEIKAAFGHLWGPEDKRVLKRGRAKWQNMLDWAKVQGKKQKTFFNRSKTINGKKVTYIVMPGLATDAQLVAWVLAKKVIRSFHKRCKKCGYKKNKLACLRCGKCGNPFPPATTKVQPPLP